MRFRVFLYELQRRHVIKAGVAYLVVAWLIVQVLVVFTDAFNIPQQTLSLSIIVMAFCFPIWLVINWFYDITEDGVVKVQKEEVDVEHVSVKSGNLNKIIITTLSIIVVLLLFNTFRLSAEKNAVTPPEPPKESRFKSSVAVMPFENMSEPSDKNSFAIGMSEEIRNRLFGSKELRVVGRRSSNYYKNKEVTFDVIARELEVEYMLEGSIRNYGDVLRISAQLIDLSNGSIIWTETYDRTPKETLTVQDEIAARVAEMLEISLLTDEIRQRQIDPEAFGLFFKASEEIRKYNKSATEKTDSLIRASLTLDDTYSRSWSLLAQAIYFQTFHYFLIPGEIGIEDGLLSAERALEIDSLNAMAYVWRSKFSWQNMDSKQAVENLEKALEINPNDPEVLYHAGNFALATNRLSDAEKYYRKAMLLDPKGEEVIKKLSFVKWTQGDLRAAERYIRRAYAYDLPDYLKNYEYAMLYRDKGDMDRAVKWMEQEKDPYLRILLECTIAHALGKEQEASDILERIKASTLENVETETIDSNPEYDFEIACLYAYMKQADSAFVYLDRAYNHVLNWPDFLFSMPDFNNLKEDPRWEAYLRRMGEDMQYDFLTHR